MPTWASLPICQTEATEGDEMKHLFHVRYVENHQLTYLSEEEEGYVLKGMVSPKDRICDIYIKAYSDVHVRDIIDQHKIISIAYANGRKFDPSKQIGVAS